MHKDSMQYRWQVWAARLALLVFVFVARTSLAQTPLPDLELERLTLNPGTRDSLVLSTGDLLPKGHYRAAITAHYEREPLVLVDNLGVTYVILEQRTTLHFSGAYAIFDWLEVGAQVPLIAHQKEGDNFALTGLAEV